MSVKVPLRLGRVKGWTGAKRTVLEQLQASIEIVLRFQENLPLQDSLVVWQAPRVSRSSFTSYCSSMT